MRATTILLILLSACAAPVPKAGPAPTVKPVSSLAPTAKPTCFAPAGSYMSFAVLRHHNCATAPAPMVLGSTEDVAPGSIKCGIRRLVENVDGHPTVMVFYIAENGMAGRMTVFLRGCRASYQLVFKPAGVRNRS